ncbi:hypothetical protein [Geomobilimonas luticola]|uniref:Uncharacterized protein n=1 Tax=Geomobilimonas luticola TaxID=1114878 RepID=A0ABS5S852_9BACT|nr:hypothetical protein [Geomobilimonas luticola]MBT0651551.1 hypothetical protein [Geomobilimonas luticola]
MSKNTVKTHDKLLDNAYAAYNDLRLKGEKPTITAIAENAGIARSTINQQKPDWVKFRDTVKGKASPDVTVGVVKISESSKESLRLHKLKDDVNKALKDLEEFRLDSVRAIIKLVEQVHTYKEIADEAPNTRKKQAHLAAQVEELKKMVESLKNQNRELKATAGAGAAIASFQPPASTINIYQDNRPSLEYDDLFRHNLEAMNMLDHLFADPETGPGIVYLLCGNFAAGKSNIIRDHRRMPISRPLYIDGTGHTRDIRQLFLGRIRSIAPNCRIVCIRVMTGIEECLKRNADSNRKKRNYLVSEELIKQIGERFEEVSLTEGFNAIELFGVNT